VRLEWLEQTANLVLAGNDKAAVNEALQELLKDKVSVGGQAERGNREKIITILLKTWLTVPSELESLRVAGWYGLDWGGNWERFVDRPHVEWRGQ